GTLENFRAEKGLHQLVVSPMAEQLRLDADGGSVFQRVGRSLPRETPLEDPFGRPPVDGVGGDLDLEHAVGNVLAHTAAGEAGLAGSALEGLELTTALVDGDDTRLGLELGLDVGILVLAGDLAYPARRVVADDVDDELGVVAAGLGERRQPRAGLGGDAGAQRTGDPRPAALDRVGHVVSPEPQREAGIRSDLDRRAGRDAGRVEEQRDAALLARMEPDRRLLEAHRRVGSDRRRTRLRRRPRWRRLLPSLDRLLLARSSAGEAGVSGGVERGSEGLVQGAQTDLVADRDLPARAHEPRARPSLLRLDDRADDALDRRIEPLDERVGIVEAAAVDPDDDLRPWRVECLPLQPLDGLAAHLAVQVTGAWPCLEAGERRLVRCPAGKDDETAAARSSRGAERDRLRRAPHDNVRRHAATELDLAVEQHRPLRVGLRRGVAHELERLSRELEQELTTLVLENRPQLHEVGDEPPQARARRQPATRERHGHPRAFVGDPELVADGTRRRSVEDVEVEVRLVAARREEPRLDRAFAAHSLNAPASLGKPDVAQAAAEEATLPFVRGCLAQGSETPIDELGVETLTVVQTDDLVLPAAQRRHAQAAQRGFPGLHEIGICQADPKLDSAVFPTGRCDRSIGVRHHL